MRQQNQGESFLDIFQQVVREVEAEAPKRTQKKHDRIKAGDVVSTNSGYAEVLEYVNANKVKLRFISTGFEAIATAEAIRAGKVKDRFLETASGGFIGNTTSHINGKIKAAYTNWKNIFRRTQERDSYKAVKISSEFYNFELFEKWYLNQSNLYPEKNALAIDSDIIPYIQGRAKAYGEETCFVIPHAINTAFTKTVEALGSLVSGRHKGIVGLPGEKWQVLTGNDRSVFDDKDSAIAYAIDLRITNFMVKFRCEVEPYLCKETLDKVSGLEQKLRKEFC